MLFTSSSVVTVLLCILYHVKGQPTLETPSFHCCDGNLSLTCLQTGFTGADFVWKKDGVPIYNDGGETLGTGRYSETYNASSFTLVISGAISDDGGAFVCNYAFQDSNPVTLQLYCPPTDNGVSVTRNDEKNLVIDISHVYPNTATVSVTKDTISLPGTTGTPTANGDYFDIQWISNGIIDDGLHAYKITVVTRTTTTVIDKEAIFGTTTTTTTTTSTSTTTTTTPPPTTTTIPSTTTTTSTMTTTTTPTTTTTTTRTSTITTTPMPTTRITTTTTPSTTTRPTTQSPPTTPITSTSVTTSTTTPSNTRGGSNTSLIAMIVVVSVIGGILIIAIVFMILVMVYGKSGLPLITHRKGTHHRPPFHHHHHRHHKHHKRRERSEHSFYQPQNVLAGYFFYRGGVANPVFQESRDYPNSPDLHYKDANEGLHAPRYDEQPPKYQYALNWEYGVD